MTSATKITLVGLGIMGAGMAHNLVDAGFSITVYSRDAAKAVSFEGRARICRSVADAVKDADIVISMLSDDNASKEVWLGGGLDAMKPGAVLVECSTLSHAWVNSLSGACSDRKIGYVDAPVTGSKQQAEDGALRFLVGADAVDLRRVLPVFRAMGTEIVPLGAVGSGTAMKLINNFLCGVHVASLAEALAVAERSGLPQDKVRHVLSTGAPGSPIVKAVAERIAAKTKVPHFACALMAKDLGYAIREAETLGVTLDSAVAARSRFLDAVFSGLGGEDISCVIEPLRNGVSWGTQLELV